MELLHLFSWPITKIIKIATFMRSINISKEILITAFIPNKIKIATKLISNFSKVANK